MSFRDLVEGILLEYIENTDEPEIRMHGPFCTEHDVKISKLFEEFENRYAKEYLHSLSDGGLYEAVRSMHRHQYK